MAATTAASLLEIERDRLQGALKHLERSVAELKQAIADEGPDQDYKDAINENVVVIAKHRARIAALDEEIRRAKAGQTTELAALPVDEADASTQVAVQRLLQQHARLVPPAAISTSTNQPPLQQQQAAAAAQQDNSSMDTEQEAAAAVEPPSNTAAAAAAGNDQQHVDQQLANGGVWL